MGGNKKILSLRRYERRIQKIRLGERDIGDTILNCAFCGAGWVGEGYMGDLVPRSQPTPHKEKKIEAKEHKTTPQML